MELFVTGTDTGVGKTAVACALLQLASRRGLRTAAMKPAESGCALGADGALVPADAVALRAAMNMELSLAEVCPYRFEAAVAPGVAAEQRGEFIDFVRVQEELVRLRERGPDLLVVEGAGGVLVPMGEGRMVRDLMVALAMPVLVVARAGLGSINHSLLTIESVRRVGLEVAGVVLNETVAGSGELGQENAEQIRRAAGVPVLGVLPFRRSGLTEVAEQELQLELLFARCG